MRLLCHLFGGRRGLFMAWGKTSYEQECDCGKRYKVTLYQQPMREKGRFNCHSCGRELERWNGGVDYSFHEIKA